MDATQILKKFTNTLPESSRDRRPPLNLSLSNWREQERLAWAAVKDSDQEKNKKLSLSLRLSVQNQLLQHENFSPKEAFNITMKRKEHGKASDFE